jgi:hypothetical protein
MSQYVRTHVCAREGYVFADCVERKYWDQLGPGPAAPTHALVGENRTKENDADALSNDIGVWDSPAEKRTSGLLQPFLGISKKDCAHVRARRLDRWRMQRARSA